MSITETKIESKINDLVTRLHPIGKPQKQAGKKSSRLKIQLVISGERKQSELWRVPKL